jgi:hypothetical protein
MAVFAGWQAPKTADYFYGILAQRDERHTEKVLKSTS